MNIGQAAIKSGLATKTVRYYEEIGLVIPARCTENDYRDYSIADVDHLHFLQRARAVGFGLDVCRELLELYRDPARRCSQVRALILDKIQEIEAQLHTLMAFKFTLTDMASHCAGNDFIDYSITETSTAPNLTMSFLLVES